MDGSRGPPPRQGQGRQGVGTGPDRSPTPSVRGRWESPGVRTPSGLPTHSSGSSRVDVEGDRGVSLRRGSFPEPSLVSVRDGRTGDGVGST